MRNRLRRRAASATRDVSRSRCKNVRRVKRVAGTVSFKTTAIGSRSAQMRTSVRRVARSLTPPLVFWFGITQSMSAACVRLWQDAQEAKATSVLVFSGTATRIKPDADGLFVQFLIDQVWKGSLQRHTELPLYMTLDSFTFDEGTEYLVFADRLSEEQLRTLRVPPGNVVYYVSSCSATRTLRNGRSLLKDLGSSKKPASP
jgi:hypothetical protein